AWRWSSREISASRLERSSVYMAAGFVIAGTLILARVGPSGPRDIVLHYESIALCQRRFPKVKSNPTHWNQIYLCVGLTTLATLLLELSLTRIFSVVFYYHFAFLAISIALFGLGVGGVLSYVVAGWKDSLYYKLGTLSVANTFLTAI